MNYSMSTNKHWMSESCNKLALACLLSCAPFSVSAITHAASSDDAKINDNKLQYSLLIVSDLGSGMDAAFEDDQSVELSGSGVGGCLTVYLNDSPIRLQSAGSTIFPIYDFVVPGKNRIRIEGKHKERIFVKAVLIDPASFKSDFALKQVLAKTRLGPKDEEAALEFEGSKTVKSVYYEIQDNDASRKELRDLISKWASLCAAKRGDALIESMVPDIKPLPSYLGSQKAAKQRAAPVVDGINSGKFHLETKVDDVKLVIGKRSAIAYAGITEDFSPYLFKFRVDGQAEPFYLNSVLVVRIDGKWCSR
jgi:hypothetical protein